ncbi:MAG: hypothetical protein LBG65_02620 [Puniceicoccales bacterium]|jgi:hypothetical protein|nr:hypothetical protein [Puniceicoccales bacterium]
MKKHTTRFLKQLDVSIELPDSIEEIIAETGGGIDEAKALEFLFDRTVDHYLAHRWHPAARKAVEEYYEKQGYRKRKGESTEDFIHRCGGVPKNFRFPYVPLYSETQRRNTTLNLDADRRRELAAKLGCEESEVEKRIREIKERMRETEKLLSKLRN